MKAFTRSITAALLCAAFAAHAAVVDIAWNSTGSFEHSQVVAAGQFAEVCGPLKAGDGVQWSFDANQPLDFNIHFHEGKAVHYPARTDQARELKGVLKAEVAQDYCWMWSNKSPVAARLRLRLQKP
jgi:hypothetical protein